MVLSVKYGNGKIERISYIFYVNTSAKSLKSEPSTSHFRPICMLSSNLGRCLSSCHLYANSHSQRNRVQPSREAIFSSFWSTGAPPHATSFYDAAASDQERILSNRHWVQICASNLMHLKGKKAIFSVLRCNNVNNFKFMFR